METVAKHPGTVVAVDDGTVSVRITRLSGCASCSAYSKCGFAEQKDSIVTVPTDHWQDYHVDDKVSVVVGTRRGLQAVFIAFILPALMLLTTFIILYALHLSELWCVLITLSVVGIYCGILYLVRKRLNSRFEMQIENSQSPVD